MEMSFLHRLFAALRPKAQWKYFQKKVKIFRTAGIFSLKSCLYR